MITIFFFLITILNFKKIAVEGTKPQKFRKFSRDIFKALLREDQNRSRKSENTLRNLSKNFKWSQFFFFAQIRFKEAKWWVQTWHQTPVRSQISVINNNRYRSIDRSIHRSKKKIFFFWAAGPHKN